MRAIALTAFTKRVLRTVHTLIFALLLFSVALVNGRPAFFGDTPFYYSQGEYLATALGFPLLPMTKARRADPDSVIPGSAGADTGHALIIAKARSPIYGLFFFLCERLGGLWLLVWVQCWVAAWVIVLVIRVMATRRPSWGYWGVASLLVVGSSLPFYTAFAMPDVFAGFDLLCLILLTVYPDRLSRFEQVGAWALLAFGIAAHLANGLTAVGACVVFTGLMIVRRRPLRPLVAPFGLLLAAIVAAVGLTAVAGAVYQRDTGLHQSAPPFFMAKVLEDGPGQTYLAEHCPHGDAPTLCRFAQRQLTSAENFLWSWTPNIGVIMRIDPNTVAQLKDEEPAFVLHAIAEHPWIELRAMAIGWAQQLTLFQTLEPLHNPAEFLTYPWWVNTSVWIMLPNHLECERRPTGCQPRFPAWLVNDIDGAVLIITLVALGIAPISSDLRRSIAAVDPDHHDAITRAGQAALLIGLAILTNAAVCGALSGPFPRYQARLIWTAPLIVWLFLSTLPWRKRSPT